MVTQSDRLDDFSSISFWLIPPGLHAGGPQEFPSASPAVTTPGHLGASRGACLACEAVVSREYRDAHLTLWSALYVRTGASSRPRARHDDRVYPILSLVHHGRASVRRRTQSSRLLKPDRIDSAPPAGGLPISHDEIWMDADENRRGRRSLSLTVSYLSL